MQYEFWARHDCQKRKVTFVPWEKVPPQYREMWLGITTLALEMGITVVLDDAHRFLHASNGDLGAAFAKALGRYTSDVLALQLPQT